MYRRETCILVLVCVLGIGITAQAQLLDPPVDNPSFEATDLGAGGGGQWVDFAEEWIINSQGNAYLEDGSWQIVAPDGIATLKLWSGAAIWQQIGTWNASTDYRISMWAGRGDDSSAYQVELWAGGNPSLFPASGFGTIDSTVGAALIGGGPLTPTIAVGEAEWMSLILNTGGDFNTGDALWLRIESIAIGGQAIWIDNVVVESEREPVLAFNPDPAGGSMDALRDAVLNWTPGESADKHDVYFGTNLDNVNNASRADPLSVLASEGHGTNSYDLGRLQFGQTYFWRIDEVNSPPDSTVFKGDTWSFTVEPESIPVTQITATASSSFGDSGPEKTVDSSGLVDDLHGVIAGDMWIGGSIPATIEYAFDRAYKLHELWIWNSNQAIESFVGFGAKDVVIEYSLDGENWTVLEGVGPLAQATGTADSAHNNTIDFGGTTARHVRVTVNAVHGIAPQPSLSEVRFYYIPTYATRPTPASDATDVAPDTTLSWGRSGREADRHEVYVGTHADDLVLAGATSESSFSTDALDFQLGQTYFWRVDEVNEAMDPGVWAGDVWSFTTLEAITVDDMESYKDAEFLEIWATWIDGIDDPTNGSLVGADPAIGNYSPGTDTVYRGGQSLPIWFDNSGTSFSEATRTFTQAQDWTRSGVQILALSFSRGAENIGNGQVYVKVNDTKVVHPEDPATLPLDGEAWTQWSMDLAALGTDLTSVRSLTVGIEGAGATGVLHVDEIVLHGKAPEVPSQPDPEDNLTVNPSFESPDLGPGGTGQWADNVDNWIIDSQGNSYLEDGTWEIVAPEGAAALKIWSGGAIWQQIGNVRPNTDYEISLFIGRGHDTSAVQVELWAGGDPSALPTSYGIIGDTVGATLIGGASLTPTIEVGQSELMGLSLNTGEGFGPDDALWIRIESIAAGGSAAWVDNVMVATP